MKNKMGRPKMPKGTANSIVFSVKIAANEVAKIQQAIKKSGLTKPVWARNALIQAASS
jgi:hypothetical protein